MGQHSQLSPAQVHDLAASSEPSAQTLQHLLQKSHASLASLHGPNLMFHTHMPHILGSSYLLGASSNQLTEIQQHEEKVLKPTIDNLFKQGGITRENWREFLNRKDYCVAYTDFFDQEVAAHHGKWENVVQEYLLAGPEPLLNGCTGGIGHPFIHFAYAYEFNSKEVATEALSLACTEYNMTHGFLDKYPTDNSTYHTQRLEDVILHVHEDKRFAGMFNEPGYLNIFTTLALQEAAMLEHWNAWKAWDIDTPVASLEECMQTATLLAITTSNAAAEYDFFLAHVLTVGHALRVLLPQFNQEHHASMMRQFVQMSVLMYIAQLRPKLSRAAIEMIELEGRDWEWVARSALASEMSFDVHFPKVVRALKVSAETWGDRDGFYLKAAVKYVTDFKGWTGFGIGVE